MLLAILCAIGCLFCVVAFFVMVFLLSHSDEKSDMCLIYFICMILFGIAAVICAAGTYSNAEEYQKRQHEIELLRARQ